MENNNWHLLRDDINNYIVSLNIKNIKWEVLNYDELMDFYYDNYYNRESHVFTSWNVNGHDGIIPLGMYYLSFKELTNYLTFFVGSIENSLHRRTIVGAIRYQETSYDISFKNPALCVETAEVNYFYRNRGVLKEMLNAFSKQVSIKDNIILTYETNMGSQSHISDKFKSSLRENGYLGNIWFLDSKGDVIMEENEYQRKH